MNGAFQRKAELEEEERKWKLEAEGAEKERQRRIEQGRVNRLLRDAAAFQEAGAIRQYVEAIRSSPARNTTPASELEQWSQWALAQADRIDPAIGGRFLNAGNHKQEITQAQSVSPAMLASRSRCSMKGEDDSWKTRCSTSSS